MESILADSVTPTENLLSHSFGAEWVRGGFGRTDLSQDVDVDSIDLVRLLESQRVWEHIRMPLLCVICRNPKTEWPAVDRVHWSYQTCKTCEGVYVCATCSSTEKFSNFKQQKHPTCSFMLQTVRPLSAPLFDGSDLEHLERFRDSRNSRDFYLFFPWFFHCFREFDEVKINYRKQLLPERLKSSSLSMIEKLRDLYVDQLPTDWFVREVRCDGWEDWRQSIQPEVNARIQTARVSSALCGFLNNLKHFNQEKIEKYGGGDIEPLNTYPRFEHLADHLSGPKQNFGLYSLPLQLSTILDPYINLKRLRTIQIPAKDRYSATGLKEILDDELTRCYDVKDTHLHVYGGFATSGNKFKDSTTLWHMFNIIFKNSSKFDELQSTFPRIDMANYLGRLKPEWYSFLARNRETRLSLDQLAYESLPEITSHDLNQLVSMRAFCWPETHKSAALLQEALGLRRRGNYEDAIELLTGDELSSTFDVFILLELQATFLAQGNYSKARDCRRSTLPDSKTSSSHGDTRFRMASTKAQSETNQSQSAIPGSAALMDENIHTQLAWRLLALVSAYAGGFVFGHWREALEEALGVFENYLKSWRPTREDAVLIIYLEIYFHRIALEAARDLHVVHEHDSALRRLASISNFLENRSASSDLAAVAWDVVSIELDLNQRSCTARYLDVENSFSVPTHVYNSDVVLLIVSRFVRSKVNSEGATQHPTIVAEALLFEASVHFENGDRLTATATIETAERLFNTINDGTSVRPKPTEPAVLLDIKAFRLQTTGISSLATFERLQKLYAELRARNDLKRLRKIRPWQIASAVERANQSAHEWSFYQRLAMQELALEAGDMVAYERWRLRKYAGDDLSITSITAAERVLHEGQVSSNLLGTIATFNLSQAYLRTGNFLEAALNALLHHSLAAERRETEAYQKAVLNVLQVYTGTVFELKDGRESIVAQVARAWNGWLTQGPYERWATGEPRCDEIDRFIDAACFLPNLARALENRKGWSDQHVDERLIEQMLNHLQTAFDLYRTLPTYLASTIVPKLSLAVGAIAVYARNKELALRAYWEGMMSLHSQDDISKALLQLEAGTLMTLLGEEDPEHWLYVVPAGRSLLSAAAKQFLTYGVQAGNLLNFCTANVRLLASVVCEARWRKIELDKTSKDMPVEELVSHMKTIIALWQRAEAPILSIEYIISRIAQNINFLKPFEASQNLATLASKRTVLLNRELALEINFIFLDIDHKTSKRAPASLMWLVIQRYKGSAMHHRYYSRLVPNQLLQAIKDDPVAWKLYTTEQLLMEQGPQSMADFRLIDVQGDMHDNKATEALINYRRGNLTLDANDYESFQDIAGLTFPDSTDVVLIDWIQYHDYFLIIGFSVRKKEVCFFDVCKGVTIAEVEAWIEKHLRVPRQDLASSLWSLEVFKPLFPLVDAIKDKCTPGDLLVFCPSQQLHAIPLHVIPYDQVDGKSLGPIINFHPIVYTPSNVIMKRCITRVLEERKEIHTAELFGRWGSSGAQPSVAEQKIADSIDIISTTLRSAGVKAEATTGPAVTRAALTTRTSTASILHYHGHVADEDLKQHLVLEFDHNSTHTEIGNRDNINHPYYGRKPSKRTDIYTLQDAFAAEVQASLVTLLGCGSGTQRVSESDDAMGLMTAFLAAGATSVVGALWPLDSSDASKFAETFYSEAFASQIVTTDKNGERRKLINLARALRSTVMELQACQNPICKKRRSLEKRMNCHPVPPYHWAWTVMYGSWFCGGSPGSHTNDEDNDVSGASESQPEEGEGKGKKNNTDLKTKLSEESVMKPILTRADKVSSSSSSSFSSPSVLVAPSSSTAAPPKSSSSAPKTNQKGKRDSDDLFRAAKGKKWLL